MLPHRARSCCGWFSPTRRPCTLNTRTFAAAGSRSARDAVLPIAALTLLAALLRLPGLDSGLWFDEILTLVESVRPPLRQIFTAFPGTNTHPLYTVLAHLAVAGFGEHAWTVRLPAVAFGVASVPMLYALASTVAPRREAMAAALLIAVSYHHVWFSQNARGYTMLLFFTLAATWLLLRLLERPTSRLALAYGVVVGLGLYTHVFMAFIAAAHAVVWGGVMLTAQSSRMRSGDLAAAFVAVLTMIAVAGLLYLPTVSQVYSVLMTPVVRSSNVATSQWALWEMLTGLRVGFGAIGVLVVGALAGLGALDYLKRQPLHLALFTLPAILTVVGIVAMSAPIRPRFFFTIFGFALLLVVRGAAECGRILARFARSPISAQHAIGTAAIALLTVASLLSLPYNYRFPKQDFGGALGFITATRNAAEPVVTAGLATYPYASFYSQPWHAVEKAEELENVADGRQRVWVVYSFEEYMDRGLVAVLHRRCGAARVFKGTLGGGDVIVCTIEPS